MTYEEFARAARQLGARMGVTTTVRLVSAHPAKPWPAVEEFWCAQFVRKDDSDRSCMEISVPRTDVERLTSAVALEARLMDMMGDAWYNETIAQKAAAFLAPPGGVDVPPLPPGAVAGVTHFLDRDILTDQARWERLADFCQVDRNRIDLARAKLKPFQDEFEPGAMVFEQLVDKFIGHKEREHQTARASGIADDRIRDLTQALQESEDFCASGEAQQRANWLADVLTESREMLRDTQAKLREVRADRDEMREKLEAKGKR